MNTQIEDNAVDDGAAIAAAARAAGRKAAKPKPRKSANTTAIDTKKQAKNSKKDQLMALLSKPNGARISVIVERLGWQAHTVRAALSGIRKQGIEIVASKSPKTGETVYAIIARRKGEGWTPNRAVS